MIVKQQLKDALEKCVKELTDIWQWHKMENIPLRQRELDSIQRVVEESEKILEYEYHFDFDHMNVLLDKISKEES